MDNLDKLFKENLKNFESLPPKNSWEMLNQKLEESNLNNNSNSLYSSENLSPITSIGSIAIKAASVMIVLGGLTIGGYFLVKDDDMLDINQVINTENIKTTENKNIENKNQTEIINPINQKIKSKEEENINIDNSILIVQDKEIIIDKPNTIQINNFPNSEKLITRPNPIEIISNKEKLENSIEETIPKLLIPNAITPNGDGINDYFYIKNIEYYPENTLVIFSRRGDVLYTFKSYDNRFDGMGLPIGTYFYKLSYIDKDKQEEIIGSLTLIR